MNPTQANDEGPRPNRARMAAAVMEMSNMSWLCERGDVMGRLLACLQALKAGPGDGCCVLVTGEPGIDKASLLEAARTALDGWSEWL